MYLSSDLMTSVKRKAHVPTSQSTFQAADFYSLADEEIRSKLLPLILAQMEEFYVRTFDYAITANQQAYLIPPRAIASKLRDVQIVNSSNSDNRFPLDRINPGDLYASGGSSARLTVQKNGFYPQGNQILIYPTPTQTVNLLRLSYYCRPSSLVDPTACALITAINTGTNALTVASLPSTMTTSTPLDFVKANPGFECSAIDQTAISIVGTVLTFSSIPTDVAVGDYVCLATQSCVVQVPVELQPLLYQYVVVRVLEAQNDQSALKVALAELQKLESNASLLISPRVDGKPQRVTNSRGVIRFV